MLVIKEVAFYFNRKAVTEMVILNLLLRVMLRCRIGQKIRKFADSQLYWNWEHWPSKWACSL